MTGEKRMSKYYFTSESVTEGHPDKVCDKISDAVLDEILKKDPNGRVACEVLATTGMIMVVGEITTECYVPINKIVRETLDEIGYNNREAGLDSKNCSVMVSVDEQSGDIASGVNQSENHEQGAGDQGLMLGFACDETKELMPLPITLAHKLTYRLTEIRKKKIVDWALPDGKSQVTVEYENGIPKRVSSVVIAIHHKKYIKNEDLKNDIKKFVIQPILGKWIDDETKYYINATGRFETGGPMADAGLTGRKIIVDTYGGYSRHGGGAFSGKDPSKVDRSGAYMARYIAKNIVASGIAKKCEVELAYSIGEAEPVSLFIDTFGTGKIDEDELARIIRAEFPLKPYEIIEHLDLKKPIYKKTSAYGHFGRAEENFSWEKTDKVDILKKYLTD
ncbi:MAG: methionine adenosyltransferase [Candidatus Marinimicrobia bacterium]|nr:methionine adenosyltransferase [Candidatus Neomarinimicrobiota bacterium]